MSTLTLLATLECAYTTTAEEGTINNTIDALDKELREISLKVSDILCSASLY
jgi:hypothetical protein